MTVMPAGAEHLTSERAARDTVPDASDVGELFRGGRRIGGRYTLIRPVSPRGRVWLARDRRGRPAALKTGPRAAIEHERRILAALGHPNIVRLSDSIVLADTEVLVLEHLAGGDLVSLAGSAPRHWLGALSDVIAALSALHAAGLVHRDLKARNVMLDDAGRARLIDFGSALPAGSTWTAGGTTPEAVDPGRGQAPVAVGDDVYALSALLFELLHGRPPGRGAASGGRRARSGIPAPLAALAAAGLAPAPGLRADLNSVSTVIESLTESQRI